MPQSFDFTGITIRHHSRAKRLTLRVDQTGEVSVTIPKRYPKYKAHDFVKAHQDWIEKQRAKIHLKQRENTVFNWPQRQMRYLGHPLEIVVKLDRKPSVEIAASEIVVTPNTFQPQDARKTVLLWLKRQAREYFLYHVPRFAADMGVQYQKISLRQQKSRWGSCSAKGNLSYNWRLIHFDPAVIDYVIIHELAHLNHLNHSATFWRLVEKHQPDFKMHRRFLKNQFVPTEKVSG